MLERTKTSQHICLAIGAGAIGKSVTGYAFRKLGCQVVFADVINSVIDELNKKKGYSIFSGTTKADTQEVNVDGITAYLLNDPQVDKIALEADYLCTAIGSKGLELLLPKLTKWIQERDMNNKKKLRLFFFENDTQCESKLRKSIVSVMGHCPDWLIISRTSIERMTKTVKTNSGDYKVIAEPFIPIIIPEKNISDSVCMNRDDVFMSVENIEAYYYRKIFTNNLGHALLGYMGSYQGYDTVPEAMKDPRILDCLIEVLNESGEMLKCVYKFTDKEMDEHIKSLLIRYNNENLNDSLKRLARDPVRKLANGERIISSIQLCQQNGIYPKGSLSTLFYALRYNDLEDPSSSELNCIYKKDGIDGVLIGICGINKSYSIYTVITKAYKNFIY